MLKKFSLPLQMIFLSSSVLFWQVFFQFVEESDTYFVMNLGRYVLEHGFPHIDPFTVHENLQLVAQQWLSGVVFWEAYKNFGVEGLFVVDSIAGAVTIVIYWRLCLFVSGGNKILSFVISFVVGLLIATTIVPRPHILSSTFLLIEVFMLEKFTRTADEKFLIPLPLISIALINLHAAVWLMSLVVCLPFLFVKNFRHIKFLLAAMLGVLLCGLINPYGVEAMTYVFRSYGVDAINSSIPEMFTISAHGFQGKCFYATEAFLIFSLTKFKVPWRYIFLSGGITFMAIMHARNIVLFYLLATLPLAYVWQEARPDKFVLRSADEQYKNRGVLLLAFFLVVFMNTVIITTLLSDSLDQLSLQIKALLLAAILFALYNLLVLKVEGRILHPTILPRKIVSLFATLFVTSGIFFFSYTYTKSKPPTPYTEAIKFILRTERPEDISLYINQGGGGLAGSFGIKYYIDSRSEVFLPANNGQKNIFEEYCDFTRGKLHYKDFLNRYDFTHIILTSEEPFLFELMSADKDFRVIYESEHVEGYKMIRCKVFVPKKD
ncbi:MAG: hypothetical protein IJP42_11885 [Selenomonadaceae bacterium]|nr:hypothetical protein [Selenomonadaceae bacterium]